MNKLKRLFSPRNLATTVASGMLLCGTLKVWADHETSVCTAGVDANCTAGMCTGGAGFCQASVGGSTYFWCCVSPDVRCGGYTPYHYPGSNCNLTPSCGSCIQ